MTIRSRVLGWGTYVPPRIVTNQDLTQWMETSHEWIVERTGIEQRHWVEEGESGAGMAAKAAKKALAEAQIEADQIDMIIYATLSPDVDFPGTGVFLQRELGLKPLPALDIRQQCTGFIYGLSVADNFIKTGMYKNIMVVGSEIHSTGLDISTRGRDVASLFGDGAGVAIVGVSDDPEMGILSSHLYADGADAEALWLEMPGSKYHPRISHEDIDAGRHFPTMQGQKVFKQAVTRLPQVILESLETNGYNLDDLDMLIPHQANLRINEFVAKKLKLDETRVHNNIQKYGNTTAATIPLCFSEALEAGKIKRGDLVCCAAFGSGFTWGSVLMRY